MSEAIQVGSPPNQNAPPPKVTQQTSWSSGSTGYTQPQQYENANYIPEERTEEGDNFFEQAGSAISSGAAYVVNGVEQFLNPEKTQSFSLNELIAKGKNVTPGEKAILESQGYTLKSESKQIEIGRVYGTRTVSGKWIKSEYGYPIYDTKTSYWWEKTGQPVSASIIPSFSLGSIKDTAWGVLQSSYDAGYDFGKNTLKPTLQEYGLYDQSRAAVYDLYNASPLKYQGTDITGDTLRIAQNEGIPVTLSGGKFVIDAQGSEYDNYAAQLGKIQTDLITKRNASIFGTGLTWDEGINSDIASLLPKSWSPKQSVIDYENSGQFGSGILKAITNVYGDWYNNKVAIAPVNALTEYGGEIAIGYATGLAIKGGTIALRVGAEGAATVLGEGAGVVSEGLTGRILGVGSRALVMGSEVEEASIAGRALNTVVNLSGKTAAAVDVGADALRAGSKVIGVGSRYIEPATNAVMTYELGSDIAGSKSYEEGIGKVVGLAVGGIGYKLGSENAVKAYDMFRTKGMSEIPIERIVDAKVISGENKFPMIEKGKTATDVIDMFKTPEGVSKGYHATPAEFKSETSTALIQGRKTDMPGLYVSPEKSGPSVNFTRVNGGSSNPYLSLIADVGQVVSGGIKIVGGDIKGGIAEAKGGIKQTFTDVVGGSTPIKPAILHIDLKKGVERLPEEARYNIPNDKTVNGKIVFEDSLSRQVYQENAGTGRTFLTPVLESSLKSGGRAEAEAVITPDTPLTKTGAEGYISFKGRRIPVLSYATEATKAAPESGKAGIIDYAKTVEAKNLKSNYSYGAIENKGILSDIGISKVSMSVNQNSNPIIDSYSLADSGMNSEIISPSVPSVKSPSSLNSSFNEMRSGVVSKEMGSVISEIENVSGSPKYSKLTGGSDTLIVGSSSIKSIPSSSIRLGPISPGLISPSSIESISPSSIRPSSISVPSSSIEPGSISQNSIRHGSISPSSISPSSIESIPSSSIRPGSISPSSISPGSISPSSIRPSSISPGSSSLPSSSIRPSSVSLPSSSLPSSSIKPSSVSVPSSLLPSSLIEPDSSLLPSSSIRPSSVSLPSSSISPSSISPSSINPSSINPSYIERSSSHIILPGQGQIFRIDKFGNDKKDEYKPKKFVTPGISGTMKKGYLKNKFGSLEGFAKKVSGNKVGFKKIKIR